MQSVKQFEYTLKMRTIFQGKLSELKSYYCREDFVLALNDVDRADKDSKMFRMAELKRLCDSQGICVEELISNRTILDSIPTRTEMQENLLYAL
ncbi:hypothetical protein [Enterococcus sp. AZ109]|uniref:hypothetical protein n=1 Tax=Enterococcus sp. AZ109 TaxID=2774634 RepID=UPI003F223872